MSVKYLEDIENMRIRQPQPVPALKRRRGNAVGGTTGVTKVDRCLHPELTELFTTQEADGTWTIPRSW
eukprot:830661-Heterocapsa_arctica.AAC.1